MTNFNITLYGHLTHDSIFDGNKTYETLGSIGNVWKALVKLSKFNINIEPTEIGEALIYVDKLRCRRASTAVLSRESRVPFIHTSDWSHIMYLNQLINLDFLSEVSKKSKFVSADICAGSSIQDVSILKHIDLLFIADDDLWLPIQQLRDLTKGDVIVHHSNGSIYYSKNGEKIETLVDKILKDINILGAGDMFAAAVIFNYLQNKDIAKIMKASHDHTYNLILQNNE